MSKSGTTVSFKYNASGLRTHKIVNGVMTKYTLHGKNVVHMTRGNDNLHFFYDVQNRPAVVVYNGTAYAYVKNLQGDIIAILNSEGTVVVSYIYDAWGTPTGTAGTMAETLGKINPFRYRGYVYDEETGLYYLRSRYYNGVNCRFLCADCIVKDNAFSYCRNRPITRFDPTGCDAILIEPPVLTSDVKDSSVKYPDDILSWNDFVALITQAVSTPNWEYRYGYSQWKKTDCVGLPKYVLNWYYSYSSFKSFSQITEGKNKGAIYNQVKDLAKYGMQNGQTYPIEDPCDIPLGAAVFVYDPAHKQATSKNQGWIHVGIYVGFGYVEENGEQVFYQHTVAQAANKDQDLCILPLTSEYTRYGLFEGVSY